MVLNSTTWLFKLFMLYFNKVNLSCYGERDLWWPKKSPFIGAFFIMLDFFVKMCFINSSSPTMSRRRTRWRGARTSLGGYWGRKGSLHATSVVIRDEGLTVLPIAGYWGTGNRCCLDIRDYVWVSVTPIAINTQAISAIDLLMVDVIATGYSC